MPITFGGTAVFNVANALAAIGAGASIGLPLDAMADGLRRFRGTPEDNPGRGNVLEIGGARVLLDYAHNPAGVAALVRFASSLPANRRLILLGQAGDRDDEAIRELARAAWPLRPDMVIVKELPEMLRGRQAGEIPALLEDELRRLGAASGAVGAVIRAEDDPEAVRKALAWARPGDLIVLLVHTRRDEVLEILRVASGDSPATWKSDN